MIISEITKVYSAKERNYLLFNAYFDAKYNSIR